MWGGLGWTFLLLVATLAIGLAANPLGRLLGIVDYPDNKRKLHATPTPQVGGIAVGLPLVLVCAIVFFRIPGAESYAAGILGLSVLANLGLGVVDDRSHIPAKIRLALSLTICLLAVWFEGSFVIRSIVSSVFEVRLELGLLAVPFTLFCLLGFQNSVNMMDGIGGLAIGALAFWSAMLGFYSDDFPIIRHLLWFLAAALSVTLYFNARGKLFFGDSGTYSISIALGFTAIFLSQAGGTGIHAFTVVLLFMIPVLDTVRLIVARLRRRVSPFTPDRNHLHHFLSNRFGVLGANFLYIGTMVLGNMVALARPSLTMPMVGATVAVYFGYLHWEYRLSHGGRP